MKAVKLIIEALYWLNIFVAPASLLSFPGYLVYYNYPTTFGLVFFIISVLAGVSLGIYWAEKARRTVGCSVYVNRIFSSADIGKPQD